MPQQTPYPALQRLEALVGEWKMESPQFPGGGGKARFEWLEGGAFLVHRSEVDYAAAPVAIMIIGGDQSIADGIWRLWREAPGFWQRFVGTFSDDGRTISGRWEKSVDGLKWEHDFDLNYTKTQ
jgi:hypothetical protein